MPYNFLCSEEASKSVANSPSATSLFLAHLNGVGVFKHLLALARKLSVTHLVVPAELLILRLRLAVVLLMNLASPVENPFVPVGLCCCLPLAQADSGPPVKCRLKKARKKPSAPHVVSAPVAVKMKRALPVFLPFPCSRRWALSWSWATSHASIR